MPNKLKLKTLKAATLTEVLIVLGIISTTMIVAVSLIVNSLYELRNNETEDAANGIMIQALEIAKSPSDVVLSDATLLSASFDSTHYYSLSSENDQNFLQLQNQNQMVDCSTNSVYRIQDVSAVANTAQQEVLANVDICLQLIITPRAEGFYEITSKVAYPAREEYQVNFIKGMRYGEFTVRQ
jgi:type II secretory pathway pseudopilin PulG